MIVLASSIERATHVVRSRVCFSLLPPTHRTTNRTNITPQYWDSITKEDLEFSVGTKQGNWDLKDHLYANPDDSSDAFHRDPSPAPISKRNSIYNVTQRASTYDLDYQQPASQHNNYLGNNHHQTNLSSGHGYPQMVTDSPQNYGDVRKSANVNIGGGQRRSESAARLFDEYEQAHGRIGGYAPQQVVSHNTAAMVRERSKPRRGESRNAYERF